MESNKPPIDHEKFLKQFQGMEDLAQHAVDSFLESLPKLTHAIELAIQNKNSLELEIAAHTLKGALSNFFAEPSKLLAWQLEQLGHGKVIHKSEDIFSKLKIELEKLVKTLTELSNGG